jgi:hypothetical protein
VDRAVIRAIGLNPRIAFSVELITVAAIPALIFAFVDITVLFSELPEMVHAPFMVFVGCAHPVIIGKVIRFESVLEFIDDAVNVLLYR